MQKYIESEALLKSENWQSLKSDFDKARAHIIILGQPAADVVSLAVFEQVKWERDTALQTLEEHGIGLGQIAKHGEWQYNTDDFTPAMRCSVCSYNKPIVAGENIKQEPNNYCPNCGADMRGETNCYNTRYLPFSVSGRVC